MADQVDTTVQTVEAAGAQPPVDRVGAEPFPTQLGSRDDPMPARGGHSDRSLASGRVDNAALVALAGLVVVLAAYVAVNPEPRGGAPSIVVL